MSTNSNIEWTGATWTPVKGCTRVSAGCDNCYAVTMTRRLEGMSKAPGLSRPGDGKSKYVGLTVLNGRGDRHFNGKVVLDEEALTVPLRWKVQRLVFVSSMSDIFHESVPFDFIDRIFAVMALCPQHTFQVLTKRAGRMADYFADAECRERIFQAQIDMSTWYDLETTRPGHKYPREFKKPMQCEWPLPNVWLGTSVESDEHHARAWELLKCPAAVRFLSLEPLLGPVDLDRYELLCRAWSERRPTMGKYIDWVIVGGESGPKARPCDVAWIRSIVGQCRAAGVPVFVKQLGARAIAQADVDYKREVDGAAVTYVSRAALPLKFPKVMAAGGEAIEFRFADRKGGDMAEWPEDLRVRLMPSWRCR